MLEPGQCQHNQDKRLGKSLKLKRPLLQGVKNRVEIGIVHMGMIVLKQIWRRANRRTYAVPDHQAKTKVDNIGVKILYLKDSAIDQGQGCDGKQIGKPKPETAEKCAHKSSPGAGRGRKPPDAAHGPGLAQGAKHRGLAAAASSWGSGVQGRLDHQLWW